MMPQIADMEAEAVRVIVLPFPSSLLAGQSKFGNEWAKVAVVKKHREWARLATQATRPPVPAEGDIRLHVHFVPRDRRGDRCNFWNRCKAYIDGIAEALGINDARFLPSMSFAEPEKPGRVEIVIAGGSGDIFSPARESDAVNGLPPEQQEAA